MGKRPGYDRFNAYRPVDQELLVRVARELAKSGLRAPAAAVLHGIGMNQREIADVLGVEQSTVSRLLKRILGVLESTKER